MRLLRALIAYLVTGSSLFSMSALAAAEGDQACAPAVVSKGPHGVTSSGAEIDQWTLKDEASGFTAVRQLPRTLRAPVWALTRGLAVM